MQFPDGPAAQRRLAVLVAQSNSIKIAFTFWGREGPEAFGLLTTQNALQIVCTPTMSFGLQY
jgi:hypothetical protein